MLSVLLYSGEFLGLCRHNPERRLQYGSVNLLIFFPGQQSTSIPRFLDCLALPSKLSQIRLLIPGNGSQHDILLVIHVLCMRACHEHPSESDAKPERHLAVLSACVEDKTRLSDTGTVKAAIPTSFPSDPTDRNTL